MERGLLLMKCTCKDISKIGALEKQPYPLLLEPPGPLFVHLNRTKLKFEQRHTQQPSTTIRDIDPVVLGSFQLHYQALLDTDGTFLL